MDASASTRLGYCNEEILGPLALEFPPTLQDHLKDSKPKTSRLRSKLFGKMGVPVAVDITLRLVDIMGQLPFSYYAADPNPTWNNVYVVSTIHRPLLSSLAHWSFYSQGHFFHLSAPGLDASACDTSRSNARGRVQLRHEDLSSADSVEFNRWRESKLLLAAIQAGQTMYTPSQILQIATWEINRMTTYDLFETNCQVFVYNLLHRTCMSRRNFTTFIGTACQLTTWTRRSIGSEDHENNVLNGYYLQWPEENSLWYLWPLYGLWHVHYARRFREISRTYQLVSKLPAGYDLTAFVSRPLFSELHWLGISAKELLILTFVDFKRAFGELGSDLKAGRYKDAIKGRASTRRELNERRAQMERYGRDYFLLERDARKSSQNEGAEIEL